MRYRKSIKICKGVKINLSKSGVGMSVGVPGVSVSTGKNGTYLNTGIPGTGLYDRQKIGSNSNAVSHSKSSQVKQNLIPYTGQISLDYHEDGTIDFLSDGEKIYDESLIREIKKSVAYKEEVRRMGRERIILYKETIGDFISVAKLSSPVLSTEDYENKLETIKPKRVKAKPFPDEEPNIDNIRRELDEEAQNNVSSILPGKKRKLVESYINDRLEERYSKAFAAWRAAKERYDTEAVVLVEKENLRLEKVAEEEKEKLRKLLSNDRSTIDQEISDWLSNIEFPFDFDVQYDISDGCILLDIDLPEIEDMLDVKPKELSSGIVKMVKKTQAEIKEDYSDCVFGLALFFASHIFGIAVAIQNITVSGYTQRRNNNWEVVDDYIYSIKFTREEFKTLDLDKNPATNCLKFENRCNQLASKQFKAIEPY